MNDETAGNLHAHGFYKVEITDCLWQKITPHALELAYSGQKNCA